MDGRSFRNAERHRFAHVSEEKTLIPASDMEECDLEKQVCFMIQLAEIFEDVAAFKAHMGGIVSSLSLEIQ